VLLPRVTFVDLHLFAATWLPIIPYERWFFRGSARIGEWVRCAACVATLLFADGKKAGDALLWRTTSGADVAEQGICLLACRMVLHCDSVARALAVCRPVLACRCSGRWFIKTENMQAYGLNWQL